MWGIEHRYCRAVRVADRPNAALGLLRQQNRHLATLEKLAVATKCPRFFWGKLQRDQTLTLQIHPGTWLFQSTESSFRVL